MKRIKNALNFFNSCIKETSWYRTNQLIIPTEEQCLYLELNEFRNDSSNTTNANIKRKINTTRKRTNMAYYRNKHIWRSNSALILICTKKHSRNHVHIHAHEKFHQVWNTVPALKKEKKSIFFISLVTAVC